MGRETAKDDEREFINPDELANWLGLGRTLVFSVLLSGELPSYKVGRRRLIRRADVLLWLEANKYCPGE
jgi:excisionase family DNA binding protein